MGRRHAWSRWIADRTFSQQVGLGIVGVQAATCIAAFVFARRTADLMGGRVVSASGPLIDRITMDDKTAKLQKAGEICQSCKKFWSRQGLPPKRLVRVPKTTERRNIDIAICPHCDGDVILKLNRNVAA